MRRGSPAMTRRPGCCWTANPNTMLGPTHRRNSRAHANAQATTTTTHAVPGKRPSSATRKSLAMQRAMKAVGRRTLSSTTQSPGTQADNAADAQQRLLDVRLAKSPKRVAPRVRLHLKRQVEDRLQDARQLHVGLRQGFWLCCSLQVPPPCEVSGARLDTAEPATDVCTSAYVAGAWHVTTRMSSGPGGLDTEMACACLHLNATEMLLKRLFIQIQMNTNTYTDAHTQ